MKKDKNSLIYRMKGFAIWGVAVIHAATLSSYAAANNWAVLWHDFLPILSDIGVPIFFFLAGFLDHKKSAKSFWCKRLLHLIIPWIVIGTLVWGIELIHFGSVAAFMPLEHFLLGYGSYLHFMRQIILLFILEFILQQYPSLRMPSFILFIVSVFSDLTGATSLWKWMTSYCFALSSLLYFESGVICRLFSPSPISQRKLLFWDAACLAACLYLRVHNLFPGIRADSGSRRRAGNLQLVSCRGDRQGILQSRNRSDGGAALPLHVTESWRQICKMDCQSVC